MRGKNIGNDELWKLLQKVDLNKGPYNLKDVRQLITEIDVDYDAGNVPSALGGKSQSPPTQVPQVKSVSPKQQSVNKLAELRKELKDNKKKYNKDEIAQMKDDIKKLLGSEEINLFETESYSRRLWLEPALSVLAIDAPGVDESINLLIPKTKAKVSLRLPPTEDPKHAMSMLEAHIEKNTPWNAKVKFIPESKGSGVVADLSLIHISEPTRPY